MLELRSQKNSIRQGDVGVAIAIAWFAQNGYPPLKPLTENLPYDLGVDMGDKICRVQVRTTYHKNKAGNYEVHLRVLGGNRSGTGLTTYFDPAKVEYLFVVTEIGEKYLIPSTDIMCKSTITLCDEKYAQYRVE
ncbi:MAG TPA: group I intron-associated PD-(D/E)XK endonuclease [Phototrophicaceae bacterium]|nr:group I intron-associated PD-(D/E)XK endonuclease [Phototrophicaceae bacterium]